MKSLEYFYFKSDETIPPNLNVLLADVGPGGGLEPHPHPLPPRQKSTKMIKESKFTQILSFLQDLKK